MATVKRRAGITRVLAALTLAAGLLLASCGDDGDGDTQTSGTDHNDVDVSFASDMIQHHAQALAIVDLTVGRDLDPEVEALAEAIRAAQGPEIETMTDWLTQWEEPIPATVRDHVNADEDHGDDEPEGTDGMDGMDDGDDVGMDMPGMMDEEQMADLEAASDGEFQDLFLTMMIEHHEGAIEMAGDEQANGRYQPAIELAEEIETSQSAEIDTMHELRQS